MNKILLLLATLVALTIGDVYMQNPRGSNNRCEENNTNRNNANRLFDSQNNGKGGYCKGPAMSFYEGSLLSVEWTNQHGCGGNPKVECNIVIQYMCTKSDDDPMFLLRDGSCSTTNTIPNTPDGPLQKDENGELTFGMNEPYDYYQACSNRDRNIGLFAADREENINRRDARGTRQNNNGNRHGYECPEERDYYPYWHPTPWRDVAILTHNTEFCEFYQSESQNVKSKNWCKKKEDDQDNGEKTGTIYSRYNNEKDCLSAGYEWMTTDAFGIDAPDCLLAPWTRHNHLGNALNGFASTYNWTIPAHESCIEGNNCNCVLRLRYNISTTDAGLNAHSPNGDFPDDSLNGEISPVKTDPIAYQDGLAHQLAIDTTQFGRTFQDRSHMFHIKPREGVSDLAKIHNLNVRGKRGNIVQAYPATEYDFAPTYLFINSGDYVHYQWTGCDNNPANNAGEGTAQTDRSNIVQLERLSVSYPATDEWLAENPKLFEDDATRTRMAYLDQTGCLTYEQLAAKNNNNKNNIEQDVQNCMKLNAAEEYFDGGLVQHNTAGEYYYMSSRNNNFTNRGHKGYLSVSDLIPTWALAVVIIGAVACLASAAVAGMVLFARMNPHSGVSNVVNKL